MKDLTKRYNTILSKLEKKIQAFAVCKSEYTKDYEEKAGEEKQAELDKRYEEHKNALARAHDEARSFLREIEQAIQTAQRNKQHIEKENKKLKKQKRALDPAVQAANTEIIRLRKYYKELSTRLQGSSNHLENAGSGNIAGGSPESNRQKKNWTHTWYKGKKVDGSYPEEGPMLKSKFTKGFQRTIHYDKDFNVTASHDKYDSGEDFTYPKKMFLNEIRSINGKEIVDNVSKNYRGELTWGHRSEDWGGKFHVDKLFRNDLGKVIEESHGHSPTLNPPPRDGNAIKIKSRKDLPPPFGPYNKS